MSTKWPWPDDTPLDRARQIANNLLSLLSPEDQATMTGRANELGETWLGNRILRWDNDDIVAPRDAAQMVHCTTADLRFWVHIGLLARQGGGYRAGDVRDAAAQMRIRRKTRPNRATNRKYVRRDVGGQQ